MSKALPRWKKKALKHQYYAVLDAIVSERWLKRGYLLHPRVVRKMRRAHFKTKPGTVRFSGRNGSATLRLDGRAP